MASVMKTTRDVRGVGLSIPRPDGPEKVTGQVPYVADLKPKGLLHAKLLRSPHAHARITRIDTSRAKALAGVRAVLTAADMPRSEEHTSELQSRQYLVCRLLLEKKKKKKTANINFNENNSSETQT